MGTRSVSNRAVVETGRDRKALVADAGFSQVSLVSALAGVLAAYGAFAVLAGLAVGVVHAVKADVDLSSQWRDLGVAGGVVVAGLLLLAYLFGGYVAGRTARRSGALQGVVVFVLGVVVAAGAAVLARRLGGRAVAADNLRNLGIPTTGSEWRDIATLAGIASLAAMLVGSLLGGALGERWHAKLLTRAVDPRIGAEAEARRDADRRAAEAEELRVASFRRVRAATPVRTRRVDGEAEREASADRTVAPRPRGTLYASSPAAVPATSSDAERRDHGGPRSRPSRWRRRHGRGAAKDRQDAADRQAATDRRTAQSAGRTG